MTIPIHQLRDRLDAIENSPDRYARGLAVGIARLIRDAIGLEVTDEDVRRVAEEVYAEQWAKEGRPDGVSALRTVEGQPAEGALLDLLLRAGREGALSLDEQVRSSRRAELPPRGAPDVALVSQAWDT